MPVEIGVGVGISFPPPYSFKPSDIIGMGLWFDAFDLNTFTFESGVIVQNWEDLISGKSLGQTTASKRPDRQVTFGKIGVDFDVATEDQLFINHASIPIDMFDGGGYMVFVFAITSATDESGRLYQEGNNRTILFFSSIAGGARINFSKFFDGNNLFERSGASDISLDTIHILEFEYNADNVANRTTVRLDGATLSMTEVTAPTGTRVSENLEGKLIGGGSTLTMDGAIYEVNLFQSIPSVINKSKIMTRLADRWGVTLA